MTIELSTSELRNAGIPQTVISELCDEVECLVECEIEYRVTRYIPGYAPKPCSNRSSPHFSDPGEPSDMEYTAWLVVDDFQRIELGELPEWVEREIEKAHLAAEKELRA